MIDCIPNSNLTYCSLNGVEQILYQLNSYTPLGIKLWVLMTMGVGAILIWSFILLKLGFFNEKKKQEDGE